MGHFCRICGRERPNEKFSGRGHRDHICKECQRLPVEAREAVAFTDEMYGFLHQSRISKKNRQRLLVLREHGNPEISEMADLVYRVSMLAKGKRKRWRRIREVDPELFAKCEAAHLIGFP